MALSLGINGSSSHILVFAEPSSNRRSRPPTNNDHFPMHVFVNHHIQSESSISEDINDPDGSFRFGWLKTVKYRPQDLKISEDKSPSALSRIVMSEIMMDIGFPLDNMYWKDFTKEGDDLRVALTGEDDFILRVLQVKDRMDRKRNYNPMVLTIERTLVLPDNEYRVLLQANSVVHSVEREIRSLICEETSGEGVRPRAWKESIFDVVRTSLIPWIFWRGILNIVLESRLDGNRKKILNFELRNALEEMAETVTRSESARDRPKPAAATAIKALPKYLLTSIGDDAMVCAICMEEITIESAFTMMPCSHEFHGPCIKQWLQESHMCPLCRFQLPTVEEEVN
ncbi:hypothetical protein Tsubulata_049619 [Turnera subulata]|uniref:RING-type E3 ubiquitin transferase n=1 Tax=Turnera subulata TaxID=218843 RepID=A0A9Q0FYT3_9ROSI|nr:hypothetical protein Tsubulata_049619 [Turnera subulata]